ncbi:hypothetical protein IFM89_023741 [Coptis chinensis]|uniref:F-box associated domain-containing protein n=1 Tax=Coptis chinensis TaxID=261450 RepID=A0A835H2B2_9MAGN|nr:hypothetical protein IFM89_023741 [Coptis chinensis]
MLSEDQKFYSLDYKSSKAVEVDTAILMIRGGIEIWGSCDGLLCLTYDKRVQCKVVCLWNPTNGQHMELPLRHYSPSSSWCCAHNTAFGIGFYPDPSVNNYFVVRIESHRGNCRVPSSYADIFSLANKTWRFAVIAFHIGGKKFQEVPLPFLIRDTRYSTDITELGGELCLVHNYETSVAVWLMKAYGVKESWANVLNIRVPSGELYTRNLILFARVDKKSFEFKKVGANDREATFWITKRSRNRVFKSSISEAGGLWFGKLLCQWSVNPISHGDSRWYNDSYFMLKATRKKNIWGDYIQLMVSPKRRVSNHKVLIFSAGEDSQGWAECGLSLLDFFFPGVKFGGRVQDIEKFSRSHNPNLAINNPLEFPNLLEDVVSHKVKVSIRSTGYGYQCQLVDQCSYMSCVFRRRGLGRELLSNLDKIFKLTSILLSLGLQSSLNNVKLSHIPRLIILEEKGYNFPIRIEVVERDNSGWNSATSQCDSACPDTGGSPDHVSPASVAQMADNVTSPSSTSQPLGFDNRQEMTTLQVQNSNLPRTDWRTYMSQEAQQSDGQNDNNISVENPAVFLYNSFQVLEPIEECTEAGMSSSPIPGSSNPAPHLHTENERYTEPNSPR